MRLDSDWSTRARLGALTSGYVSRSEPNTSTVDATSVHCNVILRGLALARGLLFLGLLSTAPSREERNSKSNAFKQIG